jgi:hypothetical protein
LKRLWPASILLVVSTGSAPAAARGEESMGAQPRERLPAASASSTATPDGSARGSTAVDSEARRSALFRGSTLLFDQSLTTQTVGLGTDYQTRNPLYEWWFAFKPRYFVYQTARSALSLNLWMNLYLEFTSSDTTTTKREPVLGPTSLWASYAHTVESRPGYRTSFHIGPRITLPTDKAARNSGQILGIGAIGGIFQAIPFRDKEATVLTTGRLGLTAIYVHPLHRATSPVDGDLGQLRQDIAGRSIVSDQLRPGMNVENSLSVAFSAGVQIVPRLDFGFSYVLLNSWVYTPKDVPICTVRPDCATPVAVDDPTTYRVSTWALASLDYTVLDEMTVSLGYYNLTSQLGPDGQRRSPFWSPDARVFLSLIANLDAIYDRLASPRETPTTTSASR